MAAAGGTVAVAERESPEQADDRRRSLIIDWRLQIGVSFALTLTVVLLINVGLILAFVLYPPARQIAVNLWYAIAIAGIEAILIAVALFYSLSESKRVVGPVQGIRRVLRAVRQGDLSQRVAARDGEHFEELIAETNQSLDALEEKFLEIRDLYAKIDPGVSDPEALEAALTELGRRINHLSTKRDGAPRTRQR